MIKKLPLIGLALFVLGSLAACDQIQQHEPTTWLEFVNDNFFFIFILLLALIPAGGAALRRPKCKCQRHDEDND